MDEELVSFLHDNELVSAERLIHNIAGLAGTFGADSLMKIAREVEDELRDEHSVAEKLLSELSIELNNFIAAIEEFRLLNRSETSSAKR